MEERAKGTGMLGRVLWVVGGVLLAVAAWLVRELQLADRQALIRV